MARRAEAKSELIAALNDWKDAGGDIERVLYAIETMIDVRIEIAVSESE